MPARPVSEVAPPNIRPRIVFSRSDNSGPASATQTPVRIIIAEDDYLVASEMEGALAEAGFDVAGVAISADEILALAAAAQPALAVMDIRLIGARDGIDAALELFARHRIRCVFATAHHTPETRARAEPARPLAWVRKPYAMPTLVDTVRRAVRDLDDGEH